MSLTAKQVRVLRRQWKTIADLARAGLPLEDFTCGVRMERHERRRSWTVHRDHPGHDCTAWSASATTVGRYRSLWECPCAKLDPTWAALTALAAAHERAVSFENIADVAMQSRRWAHHPNRVALIAHPIASAVQTRTLHMGALVQLAPALDADARAHAAAAVASTPDLTRTHAKFIRAWSGAQGTPRTGARYVLLANGPLWRAHEPRRTHPRAARTPHDGELEQIASWLTALSLTGVPAFRAPGTGAHLIVVDVPTGDMWDGARREHLALDVGPADGSVTRDVWAAFETIAAGADPQMLPAAFTAARAVAA